MEEEIELLELEPNDKTLTNIPILKKKKKVNDGQQNNEQQLVNKINNDVTEELNILIENNVKTTDNINNVGSVNKINTLTNNQNLIYYQNNANDLSGQFTNQSEINNTVDLNNKDKKKEKNKKEKKRLKKWEKWFIGLNIIMILGFIGLYLGRAIYYYNEFNVIKPNDKLVELLTKENNIAYSGDGLYQKDDLYYYRGKNVNNYVYYSGRLFRIVSIDDNVKLISNDIDTTLVWGYESNYQDSYVNKWLNNDYYNSLSQGEFELIKSSLCNSTIDISNYTCSETIEENVGLLTTEEYIRAMGSDSYLNINKYWWTLNYDEDNMIYYVNNEGTINNISHSVDTYYSYGVRPVINLSRDITYLKGEGTFDNPYVIKEEGEALLSDNAVGSYLEYSGYLWRISNKTNNYVKLIMNDTLEETIAYNKLNNYLNNDFLKNFNKEELVKCDYYTDEYSLGNKYDYSINKNKVNNYVGIPSIGDMFIDGNDEYWLYNKANSSTSLSYKTTSVGSLYGDLMANENKVKPMICVKNDLIIKEGLGTINEPLVIGE